jgi:putative transcriptional regulator
MPISYDKFFELAKSKGFTTYKIRKEKLIGEATMQKMREGGDIDTRTIAKFCKLLECQPGDILEYLPEKEVDKP